VRALRMLGMGGWLITAASLFAALAGIGGLVIGLWVALDPFGNPFADAIVGEIGIQTTELPEGQEARAFDPFEALPGVTEYAGPGARLVSIEVGLVRADGTQDLEAGYTPKPDTTYTFAREVPRPANAPPPGAGGSSTGPWFEEIEIRAYDPGQRRRVETTTSSRRTTVQYTNKGMERRVSDPSGSAPEYVEEPACAIADLWRVAIERGAPEDGVARIAYDSQGYRFTVSGFVALEFDAGCELES
jgi:hypothetical protein